MTPPLFANLMVAGASVLAIWVYIRLGARKPASFGRALGHVVAATLAVTLVHAFYDVETAAASPRGTAMLFGLFLPAATYAFLGALYLLEHLHRALTVR